MADRVARALFVNSGILGHRTVAALVRESVRLVRGIAPVHVDLSADLTWTDRAIRRLLSVRLAPVEGPAANLDLRRWRQEVNVGLLAARRIAQLERQDGAFGFFHFHTQAAAYGSLRRMQRTPSIVSIDCTQRLASEESASAISRVSYSPNIAHDRAVFRRAAAVIATSRWAAADLIADCPDCGPKVHVLPYPVRSRVEDAVVEQRFRRAGRSDRRVRVLFMGGDFPRKGGPELLDAWRAGGFAGRADLDLVTDWPLAPDAVPEGVRLMRGVAPHSAEWTDLWRSADLFAMPTRHEAFGMVFQEAAAAGLPVVATRLNAVPEIVEDGKTGILVPPFDRAALVRALAALVDSADLRRAMGAAALARIAACTPSAYAAGLERIVGGILDTHGLHAA